MYNEALVFEALCAKLEAVLASINDSFEILFIDDGSTDATRRLIKNKMSQDQRYRALLFSRNFGHQAAVSAGMLHCNASKGIVVMDADLQDPPEMIPNFIEQWKAGYKVIYAIRQKRSGRFLKKALYHGYYRLQNRVTNIKIPKDSGDFAFLDIQVVQAINRLPERSRYVRGLRSWVGFKQIGIPYNRPERQAGASKYTYGKLFKLALDGLYNFSHVPVKLITSLGLITFMVGFLYLLYNLIKKFVFGGVPEGFTALLLVIVMFAGVQLIALGLIGEYVLRIFHETKQRPLYIVEEELNGLLSNTDDQ